MTGARGQASVLLVGGLLAVIAGAAGLGALARGLGARGDLQAAADVAALSGARAMRDAYGRLFEPASLDGAPNPRHLEKNAYLALGSDVARRMAQDNRADRVTVDSPDAGTFAPVRLRVRLEKRIGVGAEEVTLTATATAELAPPTADGLPAHATGGGYDGPLAYRQGKPMRPDVATAFDRMERAAREDGVALAITSAFRSDAEQAILFARNPDPRWVAPPGKSLHRYGTELDLGPEFSFGWLKANAPRFGFVQRYSWEPWHWGYSLNARSRLRAPVGREDGRSPALPAFVPARYAPLLTRAAQRWNVSAALLAAQIYAESNFNPFARSRAGAQGIAQFMPATARAYGLKHPDDPAAAIDAQAHLMRDLLRRFGSVPLALAAYNAGPAPVAACGCVPPYPETRGYVARILGLLNGAGDLLGADAALTVRLVAAGPA